MAQRRMFSKSIIESARFLRMPISSQALYFHLGIKADDDGVVEAYTVLRMTGSTEDDLRILSAKGLIIVLNDDLVSFITDWKEHNKIRADRKIDSIYKDLLVRILPDVDLIEQKQRADVKQLDGQWTTNGQPMDGIGKDRLGKDRLGEKRSRNSTEVKYADDSPYMELSNYLYEKMLVNNPKAKKPNFQKWADDIRKLVEIDKYDVNEVRGIIDFSQSNSFWKTNVLSGRKLREQYETLFLQNEEKKNKKSNYSNSIDDMLDV